jgi:Right handed beta helix region/RTX calcium-binding nonapeptide repeat (4 copies)
LSVVVVNTNKGALEMSDIISLSGDHGLTSYRVTNLSQGTTINAKGAKFIQDNWAGDGGGNNPYPFLVYSAPGAIIVGGSIVGQVDQAADWRTVYNHGNSAGVRIEDSPNAVIRDWRISDTWDAIRVSWNSPDFLIEDVWVTNARDDAVENDRLQTGTIRDSLFDGVFGGISIDPSSASPVDGHNNTVTLDSVLMRLQVSNYEGETTHASFIKTDSATPGTVTPNLRFINNVIAIEDVNHHSYRSMFDAWSNTIESRGNVFLNLSDKPLPSGYPMPPSGWTVLQGQAARDYWQHAKTAWISNHADGTAQPVPPDSGVQPPPIDVKPPVVVTPPPTDPVPTNGGVKPIPTDPVSQPSSDTATFSGVKFRGTAGADHIVGNDLVNVINGYNGSDIVKGGAGGDNIRGDDGTDALWGGAGDDVFFFKRSSDSNVKSGIDTIMDFTSGDKIDLSVIDANRSVSGDQAFALVSGQFTAPGQLKTAYDAGTDLTTITGNLDHDIDPELVISVKGHGALSAVDFIL